jgi:hypothetical protein
MDGRSYLEKLISDRLELVSRNPRAPFDRSEIRGVGLGLVAASALRQEEMEEILAGLDHSLESLGRYKEVNAETGRPEAGPSAPMHRKEHDRVADAVTTTSLASSPTLLRVLPLVGQDVELFDQPATLVSLEIWSTSVRLHVAYPSPQLSGAELLRRWRSWHAFDNTGVQYREAGGGSSDSGGFLVETRIFEPGPADEATALTVRARNSDGRESQFTVPLQSA